MIDDILILKTAPTTEPLTIAQAKAQVRVETDDEDESIASLITAARAYVEETTGRSIISQTWAWQHVSWDTLFSGVWVRHGRVIIPRPPLISATIAYLNEAGVSTPLAVTEYLVTLGDPGTIEPSATFTRPALAEIGYPITITFVAGYGYLTKTPVPIVQAMKMLVDEWYNNRASVITGSRVVMSTLPHAVEALLNLYRWYL